MRIELSINNLLRLALACLGIFLIYHVILKILGGSLGTEQFILLLLSGVLAHLYYLTKEIYYLKGEFAQFKKVLNSLAADFKAHLKSHL
ncbi:hypothetical protein HYY74_06520 [Candidatus Woesearchaeota archaeon]|nr:hypothetical protein [Candidatus Woesearchaeota archaeon]